MASKWIYAFDEVDDAQAASGGDWEETRALLGGKGANLGDMTRIGVPVPPGFTISTEACNAYLAAGEELPDGLLEELAAALQKVEEATGKSFGDASNPLLVSCRSGSKFSMPGMMDTVLNIGMNDEVVEGMVKLTNDERFAYDAYRRLVQMFGSVVLGVRDEPFEYVLERFRAERGVSSDSDLTADDFRAITEEFKAIVERFAGRSFPQDATEQLHLATEAVFRSWNGKRAIDYRNAAGISHDLGTAVNIQTMVFGNMGEDSATGVAMSRNATTGEPSIEGDYLTNAQGEDVVAGTRVTKRMEEMSREFPDIYTEFTEIAKSLEEHYREMQDMEFTIEMGKLWILQTRDGKRTAQAAVRIAVDMAEEGLITQEEAISRVKPEQIDFFLHPSFAVQAKKAAKDEGRFLATGLNVSPGAAVGMVAFDADLAERWAKEDGRDVIMVRPETKPDDVHGMLAANGIVTSRGGRTSHAALVARQFGKPAVVGAEDLIIDLSERVLHVGDRMVREGEVISIDGTSGEVIIGEVETRTPDLENDWLKKLLEWADQVRDIGVWTNADNPDDARLARSYGAEGIGLTRTEHMFFGSDRLPIVQKMITASIPADRVEALAQLLPFQREDFVGLFRAMDGLPVTIRLIDPPLHEFLPSFEELTTDLTDLKIRIQSAGSLKEINDLLARIEEQEHMLQRVESLRESNPMLGLRGVRLGIVLPGLTKMQVRAIFEAACQVSGEGAVVKPKVMIPLTAHVNELARQREELEEEAQAVMSEQGVEIDYEFGTMIEIPRAALTADEIARHAEFISFGTNDLTQMTFGISRDDAEKAFLVQYLEEGILARNPFATIDPEGVGELMRIAVEKGRATREGLNAGICGEHGGDPDSIALCRRLGLDYVSCSPPRVPVARLAAAQASIKEPMVA
ncbi:MAG: pyruvate, phosphate dikinase [Actinobacteria bacterium]|nr:MAG: pyruvate, phosphate dikinase [Actinomycetota bacterium]REK39007.1 MAG: pyruvate, phosphate dikinase [Actinomycetota bacterium]